MPESKRDIANKELSDTSINSNFLDTIFPPAVSLPEDAPSYEQNLNSENNYNVTVNLNGNENKPSKKEVSNVVNNIINNQVINSPEELKKNLPEDSSQKDGSSETVIISNESSLIPDESTPTTIEVENTKSNNSTQNSNLIGEQISDNIGIQISPPHEPFYVEPPLTFDLDYFGEMEPSEYARTSFIEKNNFSLLPYQVVNNIIQRSIQPVSSGGISKNALSDAYINQISYIERNIELEPSENETFNKVSDQSKVQEIEKNAREQDNQNSLKEIKSSISPQAQDVRSMNGVSSIAGAPLAELSESKFKIYSGDNSMNLFTREKNSPPNWRTVTS